MKENDAAARKVDEWREQRAIALRDYRYIIGICGRTDDEIPHDALSA